MPIGLDERRFGVLLQSLYDAALEESLWAAFLDRCAEHLCADSGLALAANNVRTGASHVIASARMDPAFLQAYKTYYGSINVYVKHAQHKISLGVPQTGEELVSPATVERTEYFNDFMRPQKIYHSVGMVLAAGESNLMHIGAVRSKGAGEFRQEEIGLLNALAPHLQSAAQLRERMAGIRDQVAAATALLDRIPFAVFILSDTGKVLQQNRRAEEVIRARDAFRLVRGKLQCLIPNEDDELQRLIGHATSTASGKGTEPGGTIKVHRSSKKRAYGVTVTAARLARPEWKRSSAALLISDPEWNSVPLEGVLQQLHGLTPAEARIAARLANGDSLETIASELRITMGTVRIHVKRIFAKTDTRRQAQLVRLVLTSPASLLP